MLRVINFLAFYVGWFACVAGAGRGHLYLGPLVVAGLVALHLCLVPDARRELRLVVAAAVLGYAVDTGQTLIGVLAFGASGSLWWLPPLWLLGLWFMFATTLNVSFRALAGRYRLAAVLGAISGPLSYYAGVRLGAAEFPHPVFSVFMLALAWALLMPVMVRLSERSRAAGVHAEAGMPLPERTAGLRSPA